MANTQWNGEPCAARRVTVIVADNTAFPMYWARRFVGMRRKAVEVHYGGDTFYLDDEDGSGWNKVTHGGSPWWTHSNLTVEPGSVEPREITETPDTAATQATEGEHVCKPGARLYYCPASGETESDCHGGFDICCDRPDLHQPVDTGLTARDEQQAAPCEDCLAGTHGPNAHRKNLPPAPATITDPAYLREQYAAAVRDTVTHIADLRHFDTQIADAVMRVRDRHLQQLRQRLRLAGQAHRDNLAAEPLDRHPAIAAWGNAFDRAEQAEQQRDQLAADLRYALDDHGPDHNHIQPGRWDDTGKPCDHCARLEQARQHLAQLDQVNP